jgi:glycosyltransferase involved in cell wall biosynthesis
MFDILPSTSVIICSRNRPRLLLDSVESMLGCDELPSEIIIMDQSDEPHAVLASLTSERGCQIRYQSTNTVGECPARNAAIRFAGNDILGFVQK